MTDEPTNIREWWEKHKDENGVAFMPLKLNIVNRNWVYVGHISGQYNNLKPPLLKDQRYIPKYALIAAQLLKLKKINTNFAASFAPRKVKTVLLG